MGGMPEKSSISDSRGGFMASRPVVVKWVTLIVALGVLGFFLIGGVDRPVEAAAAVLAATLAIFAAVALWIERHRKDPNR
ncbi:hypothetical protein ACIA3K_18295 [Micromonospora sp. NPDC051543]|uniref:hypothetical protein n=1 Tax=Micromonospora sp. NPDC051543 TaxID=3364287 RepID=UPI0037B121FC